MIRSPFLDVDIPDVSLPDFVLAGAGRLGDKPALIDGPSGRTISYAQLVESVSKVAVGLAERGFGKGGRPRRRATDLERSGIPVGALARRQALCRVANRRPVVFDRGPMTPRVQRSIVLGRWWTGLGGAGCLTERNAQRMESDSSQLDAREWTAIRTPHSRAVSGEGDR